MKATARRISQSRAGFAAAGLAALLAAVATGPAVAEVKRLQFPVNGMHSPLASRGIEQALGTLPGVARVTADRGTGRVQVEAESQKSLNLQDVRTRAARAGFPVSGDLDVLARGRFETGAERRLTFKVTGTSYAWQVLESGTLLEISRRHPGLRGEFVVGFRLFEKPPWNRPAISLAEWEAVPGSIAPPAPSLPRPSVAPSRKPAAKTPGAKSVQAAARPKPRPAAAPATAKKKKPGGTTASPETPGKP